MGRLSSSRPHTQCHMLGTCVNDQVNAGGSAMLFRRKLLHGDAVLTHLVTQKGRDHLVKSHRKQVTDDCQRTSVTCLPL